MDILEILLRDSLDLLDRLFIVEVKYLSYKDKESRIPITKSVIKNNRETQENNDYIDQNNNILAVAGREDPQRKTKAADVERSQT